MFLVNKLVEYSDSRYTRVFKFVDNRKIEVLDLIDEMFERVEVSDELARNMGLEFADEVRDYVKFEFRDGDEDQALDYFESTCEHLVEDVETYVREKRKVEAEGIRSVRRLDELDGRSVYVVMVAGMSYSNTIHYRETELSGREFLMALPELRRLVDRGEDRNLDLDEFSRVRMPLDEEGYLVERLLDVKIYYVDHFGNIRNVELV